MNLLIKDQKNDMQLNIWNEPAINKIQNNYKNVSDFRKKMAFRFRYMNYSPRKLNLKKIFKVKDEKMNKILKISKSIPNFLLSHSNSSKNKNNFGIKNLENNEGLNLKKEYKDNIGKKEYGFNSPFKLKRYIGNLYDYYRSNHSLNENYLIFKNSNTNNINENIDNMIEEIKSQRIKENITNVQKDNHKKNKLIKLSSLIL